VGEVEGSERGVEGEDGGGKGGEGCVVEFEVRRAGVGA